MLILTIRTDQPEAEIGLFDDHTQLAYRTWLAHRQLAETIHQQLAEQLQSVKRDWTNLTGIVVYKGPGSFTGLRIGGSVTNALAYGLAIPIVSEQGKDWIAHGISRLQKGETEEIFIPEYGSPAHITRPRK